MQKPEFLFTALAAVFSAAGMLLRRIERLTAVDPATGLASPTAATWLLLAVMLLAAAASLLFARRYASARPDACPPEEKVFRPATALSLLLGAVYAGLMLLGAVRCLRGWYGDGSILRAILALLAALAGLGGLGLRISAWRQKRGSFLAAAAQVLFFCFFVILYYKAYAPNPALIRTMYPFFAMCAAILAYFSRAGYLAERALPRRFLALSLLSICLLLTAMPGLAEAEYRLFFGAAALDLYLSAILFLNNRS